MSKLVVDIDKILTKLKNYSIESNEFKSSVKNFNHSKVNCSINEIENNINEYIDKIGTKLSNISNKAIEFYEKVDQSCTEYQNNENELDIKNIEKNMDNITELIDNNPRITTEYKGKASEKLSSFKTTKLTLSGLYKAQKIVEKYSGRDISSLTHEEFLEYIGAASQLDYKKSGILPSVTMAQAICESGWGKYSIGNNLFGIKCGSGWTGKRISCGTKEQSASGNYYSITADFRDYDSIVDGVADHSDLLNWDHYAPVKAACDNKDAYEACRQLKACGYATSHTYANTLISIINDNDLTKYDNI